MAQGGGESLGQNPVIMNSLANRIFTLLCAGLAIAGFSLVIYWPLSALGILDMINIESHR